MMKPDSKVTPTADARSSSSRKGFVCVRGASEHNLQHVDVDIPRDALVVFTGVSGSGKSSLAFGTLYAEAQRRYFESVAPYARRLIDQVGVPAVESIEGLPPAIALQQQRGTPSARSSVGSISTLSSLLRMLYSRAGSYPPDQPMLFAEDFSPNTPQGACPACHGLGHVYEVSERTMVPDDSLTIRERAVAAWPPAWHGQNLRDILVTLGYDVDTPWRDLPRKDRDWILFTDEQPTVPVYAGFTPAETRSALRRKMAPSYQGTFTGARRYVLQTFATTQSALMKRRVSRFMEGATCSVCQGKRLKAEALHVLFAGHDIGELARMSLSQLAEVLEPAAAGHFPAERGAVNQTSAARDATASRLDAGAISHSGARDIRRTPNLSPEKQLAAQRIAQDVLQRVSALTTLGLGYLSMDRSTPTLSPGELQRLRLATQLHSNLFGVIYVLDEPSSGLHPADAAALLSAMAQLKQAGNSLFVVEHDLEVMRQADWIVDVGPDAGERGGRILYSGPPAGLQHVKGSHTARYLFASTHNIARPPRSPAHWLRLAEIHRNNLHGVSLDIPLGVLTAVTGVSGSGKSSLIAQALVDLISASLGNEAPGPDETPDGEPSLSTATRGKILSGAEHLKRLVVVDQKPIGRTPRSNLATYIGFFDQVRKLFAATPAAQKLNYDAGNFSFNVQKGRCPSCEGEGAVSVELLFMPSVYAPCSTCHGARYNPQTLKIRYQGKNIAEILAMTVEEATTFFASEAPVHRPLALLNALGLGYLRLGQPATELSGGEAQRIKLATELQRNPRDRALYVLDEPTTGLHPADVDRLMAQLEGLVDAGHTIVIVEHEMTVIARCDWVIDIGPGAGDEGGLVVACGTPADLCADTASVTGRYLRSVIPH